ncbi:MAG: CHAT domain-containing tetratricopeptide repeat protein, partial [Bacteroidota bacterium]
DLARTIAKRFMKDNAVFEGLILGQKGVLHYHLNELDSSAFYLNQSHELLESNLENKDHVYLAKVLNDLGVLFQEKGAYGEAISYYLKSLGIYKKVLGKVHPYLGKGYNNVARLYLETSRYEESLATFQVAMISNVFDFSNTEITFNPGLESILSDFILLKSLSGKVESLEKAYIATQDTSFLYTSLTTYDLITDLIDKLRTGYVSTESKQFLSQKTSYLYEKAIQVCLELSRKAKDSRFTRYAFKFSEKSRSGMLLSSIKDAKAKRIADVPDSLLIAEESLLKQISEKESEWFEELNKGARKRARRISLLKDELFHLRNEYSNHVHYLEDNYRHYYQLKYDTYTASVSDVQEKMLQQRNRKDKRAYVLLEYFVGQDSIYRFQISKDAYQLVVTSKPVLFDGLVKGLRNSLNYQMPKPFTSLSMQLSELLLPTVTEKRTHLTIVPDGVLSYLPFESLIVEESDKPISKQPFLIKGTSVSYSYSATLSVEMTENASSRSFSQSFSGFAPVFTNQNNYKVLSSNKEAERSLEAAPEERSMGAGSPFIELPYSETELASIHQKLKSRSFNTHAFFYAAASKENLIKEQTLNSRFLHFATHGLLDARHPEYSGIILADSANTDILTIGEVYGLDLTSEVVTLSACETGMGKLVSGEGLVSFSRGFFYSGTNFIIVSLWKIADESTSEVMKHFYARYARKQKKDIYKSFQKSRLKVIRKKKYDQLADWFPFVLVGMD